MSDINDLLQELYSEEQVKDELLCKVCSHIQSETVIKCEDCDSRDLKFVEVFRPLGGEQ